MSIDPVLANFLERFLWPVVQWLGIIAVVRAQYVSRKPHPLIYGVIGELVVTKTFAAHNLVNLGLLKPEPDISFNPLEVLKIVRGGS